MSQKPILGWIALALATLLSASCATTSPPPKETPAPRATPSTLDEISLMFRGPELYETMCSNCHGLGAEGDGPLANLLKVATPDLTLLASRNNGNFPADAIREKIDGSEDVRAHGTRLMPVWGISHDASGNVRSAESRAIVEQQINLIVDYLRSLQTAGTP